MPFSVVSVEAIIQKMHVICTMAGMENEQNMSFPEGQRSVLGIFTAGIPLYMHAINQTGYLLLLNGFIICP